jgi:hypothetical protein
MDNFDLEIKKNINLFEIEMRDDINNKEIQYYLYKNINVLLRNESISLDELNDALYHEIHYK